MEEMINSVQLQNGKQCNPLSSLPLNHPTRPLNSNLYIILKSIDAESFAFKTPHQHRTNAPDSFMCGCSQHFCP